MSTGTPTAAKSALPVAVVGTGIANTASVLAALTRLGAAPFLTRDPVQIRSAPRVVLPGVGAFGAASEELRSSDLIQALHDRLQARQPTLCICLGLQLLAQRSEESPDAAGLALIPGTVTRFTPSQNSPLRVPQLGWNTVTPSSDCRFLQPGAAYFANSYKLDHIPAGWSGAITEYGGSFVAAVESGGVLACQFHPELSGTWGLDLLSRWLHKADTAASTWKPNLSVRTMPFATPQGGSHAGLMRRVIPCLDCRDGRVVKGVKFQNLRDAGDPAELAARYQDEGADELVILDVSATPDGRAHQAETVQRVRHALSIPLTVGGGVRTLDDAARLLDAGADKVGVNTAAVLDPTLLSVLAQRFGRQCVVLAVDAQAHAGGWRVVIRSGTQQHAQDAVAWCAEGARRGAGEILLTSWDRDGTRAGYDLDLLRAVAANVNVPVIASGGAAHAGHLAEALHAGADAVLAASIFHDAEHAVGAVKHVLAAAGLHIRPV